MYFTNLRSSFTWDKLEQLDGIIDEIGTQEDNARTSTDNIDGNRVGTSYQGS